MKGFISSIASKDEGPFLTFEEAFTNFWTRFTAMVTAGCPKQMLDWCWIEGTLDDGSKVPLLWGDAKDLAYDLGLLVERGELQQPTPEIDSRKVEITFMNAKMDQAIYEIGVEVEILAAQIVSGR